MDVLEAREIYANGSAVPVHRGVVSKVPLDTVVSAVVGVAAPAVLLGVVSSLTGLRGAPAMTNALKKLGGPLGMSGGPLTLAGGAVCGYGGTGALIEGLCDRKLRGMRGSGESDAALLDAVSSWPISEGLRCKLRDEYGLVTAKEEGR